MYKRAPLRALELRASLLFPAFGRNGEDAKGKGMKRSLCLIFAATLTLTALTGCFTDRNASAGKRGRNPAPSRPATAVAVAPFTNAAKVPGSGLLVADAMAAEMKAAGGFEVTVAERSGEDASDGGAAAADAPYLLTGRVTAYSGKSGNGEHPTVGVAARLIEKESGKVVWSGTRTRKGSAAWFQEDSVGVLASRVCGDLVKSLDAHIAENGLAPAAKTGGETGESPASKSGLAAVEKPARAKKAAAKSSAGETRKTVAVAEAGEGAPSAGKRRRARAAEKAAPDEPGTELAMRDPLPDASGLASAIISGGGPAAEPTLHEAEASGSLRPPPVFKNGDRIVSKPVYANGAGNRPEPARREPDQVLRLTIPSGPRTASVGDQAETYPEPMYERRLTDTMM